MLKIRTVILSIALVAGLVLVVPLVITGTGIVSDPSSDPLSVLADQGQHAGQDKAPIASYRSRLGECFDVPLREATACRTESQSLVPSSRPRLDECFDVSISELASCRNGG